MNNFKAPYHVIKSHAARWCAENQFANHKDSGISFYDGWLAAEKYHNQTISRRTGPIKIGGVVSWQNPYIEQTFIAECVEKIETRKSVEYTFRELKERADFWHRFKLQDKKWYKYCAGFSTAHDPEEDKEGDWNLITDSREKPKKFKLAKDLF
jgi:hypothetical protein